MVNNKLNQKTLLFTLCLATVESLTVVASPPVMANNTIQPDLSTLVKQVSPATVSICTLEYGSCNAISNYMFGCPAVATFGSGFIIDKDGYVLTNHHVINGAHEITVRLYDSREYSAELIGADERTDLALLKVEANNLPVVKISEPADALKPGQDVFSIGSPHGFLYGSISKGVISALNRNDMEEGGVPFIQTDTAINIGNSGGPLFNMKGEVIGINMSLLTLNGGFEGISFAIPTNYAMHIVNQLKKDGRASYGWLGVMVEQVDFNLAEDSDLDRPDRVLLSRVVPGSPAEGKLQPGDIIIRVDGHEVNFSCDLSTIVGCVPVGKSVEIELIRLGSPEVVTLPVGKLSEELIIDDQCNCWWCFLWFSRWCSRDVEKSI